MKSKNGASSIPKNNNGNNINSSTGGGGGDSRISKKKWNNTNTQNEADEIKIKSSFSSMMIKRFQQRNKIKERKKKNARNKRMAEQQSLCVACVCVRADVSNRHKTEWRKMVYERRVNDLYFMPFFSLYSHSFILSHIRSHALLVRPLARSLIIWISQLDGRLLIGCYDFDYALFAYLLRQWSLPNSN